MASLKKPGPPRKAVYDWIIEELETSYEDNEVRTLYDVEPSEDVDEFLSACKLHAKHRGLSFRFNWDADNLHYQMTDKRAYRKNTLPRETN